MVKTGSVKRNALVEVHRNDVQVGEGIVSSLRRFKEDVKEVFAGYECGIGIESFPSLQESDIIKVFEEVEKARRLELDED